MRSTTEDLQSIMFGKTNAYVDQTFTSDSVKGCVLTSTYTLTCILDTVTLYPSFIYCNKAALFS